MEEWYGMKRGGTYLLFLSARSTRMTEFEAIRITESMQNASDSSTFYNYQM